MGRLRLTPFQFYDLTFREFENMRKGFEFQQQWEASNFRAVFGVIYNAHTKKGHQKDAKYLWPLPLIDGPSISEQKTTRKGQIGLLEKAGFSANWELLPDKDISWLRYFAQNRISGPDDWLPDGETVKGNIKRVKEFCKEKGIEWQMEE